MTTRFANKSFAFFILLMNIWFISATFSIIINDGGPMGIGYLALPSTLILNLSIIPAILVVFKKFDNDRFFLTLNIFSTLLIFSFIIMTLNFM